MNKEGQDREGTRRFSVSANRGQARHRIRYVESAGPETGQGTDQCTLCTPMPKQREGKGQ